VTIAFGPATHFQLEAASTTPTAGEADNLTITAKDASNNTVGTYSGSRSLSFEGATEAPNGANPVGIDETGVEKRFTEPTEIAFTEGKATVSGSKNGVMKLYNAEEAHIKVKEGSLNNGAGLPVRVTPGPFKSFHVVPSPIEPEAGGACGVKLTALDEWHNTITSYTRTSKLHYEGAESSPSGKAAEYSSTTEPAFSGGEATVTGFKFYKAAGTTLKVKEEVSGHEGSGSFIVKAASANSFSVPTPSEREAGVAFSVTLTATDEWGNTATGYAGSKTLTWSGPVNSPNNTPPEYPTSATTVTFTEGVGTASSIKLYDAQSITLKAKEGTIEGTSGSFTVKAASANSFSVPTPSEQEAGVAFKVTVTAWDAWHNTAKSYAGSKTLTWSGPASSPSGLAPSYPATVTFTAGVSAASTIKLYDAQSITLKAKEGTIEGTSGSFIVKAAATTNFGWSHAEVTAGSIEAGSCPFTCTTTSIGDSKKFRAHASVTDKYGNIVSNLGGTNKARIEKTSGEGTLTNATGLTIPTSGLAESSTLFEYTSPASGTSEAVLELKKEEGTAYTEAEAHVKY
jgi:hypothetical protein